MDVEKAKSPGNSNGSGHASSLDDNGKIKIKDRLEHWTWANYLLTMSTGGYATLLAAQPHTFRGLRTIGKIVFIFDLVAFCIITTLLINRFRLRPHLFIRSLRNPTELLFVPTCLLSLATIITGIQAYGVPSCGHWLITTVRVLFWIYVALAFLLAVSAYLYLFTAKKLTTHDMTPSWLLPIFSAMLTGTIAASITESQPETYKMSILVAGLTFQGLGFWAAIPLFGTFISRLMQDGLPSPNLRPGMFIAVGPPSFTCLAIIRMSHAIPTAATYFMKNPTAVQSLIQIALAFGIFIWSLSFWFFSISLASCLLSAKEMSFHLVYYGLIFPNVGFTIATISIGQSLYSEAILWVGSAMTILLTIVYISVLFLHARAVYTRQILWPGRDEDKDT